MSALQYEYANLLDYLGRNKVSSSRPKVINIPRKKVEIISPKIEIKQESINQADKLNQVLEKTKEIVKISREKPKKSLSKRGSTTMGFNVKQFEELMRIKLIDDYKRLQSYERPYISVSELYSCLRKSYYNRMKYPVDVRQLFNFSYLYMIQKIGNEIHDIIQNLYNFSEVEKTIVSEKYKVKGRCDAIRDNFLYEIKTIDVDKFYNKYEENHYVQGLIYSYILNTEYNYHIDTITIIYVIRNLKKIVPFDIKVIDLKSSETFLGRALVLKESLNRKEVPEPIGFNKDECIFCPFKIHCEKDPSKISRPFDTKKIDSFLL